jgi:hypothetical protein
MMASPQEADLDPTDSSATTLETARQSGLVSNGDQPATTRRPVGDHAGRKRERVRCEVCNRTFRWNCLERHRRRRHAGAQLDPTVKRLGAVDVLPPQGFALRIACRCPRCKQVIPAGATDVFDDRPDGARRAKWTHLVCPVAASGASPPNPQREKDSLPTLASLATPSLEGSPFPPRAGDQIGDPRPPLLTAAQVEELGVTKTRVSKGLLVIELRGRSEEEVRAIEQRLLGGGLVRCTWCVGEVTTVLASMMEEHVLIDHAEDLRRWVAKGVAEDARVLEERHRARKALPAPKGTA